MGFAPAGKVLVVSEATAWPFTTRSGAVPISVDPAKNWTVPVGNGGIGEVTVAVMVAGAPNCVAGGTETVMVAIAPGVMTSPPARLPLLLANRPSVSVKFTTTECGDPVPVRVEVVKVATPPTSGTPATSVPSMLKVTVPAGVPGCGTTGETVAVKVTVAPNGEGFRLEVTTVWEAAGRIVCVKLIGFIVGGRRLASPA